MEKIPKSNPEQVGQKVYLVVLPDGSVGNGFTTGNFRGKPLLQRNGTTDTTYSFEVRYETIDSNGGLMEETMFVPEYQLSPDVQAILRQRQ